MPPINQQGSRTGLIATMVIAIVLLMVTLIMWIYTNTQLTKTTTEKNQLQQQYNAIVASTEVAGGEGSQVALLNGARDKLGADMSSATTVEVALAQIKKLTADITGTPANNYADADARAADAVAQALAALKNPASGGAGATTATSQPGGSNMPAGESLATAVEKLSAALKAQAASSADAKKKLAAVQADIDTKVKNWGEQLAAANTAVAEMQKKYEDAQKQLTDAAAQYQTKQTTVDDASKKMAEDTGKQVQDAQTAVAQAKADLAKVQAYATKLENELKTKRVDTKNSVVRQADGTIVRVPSSTVCYISLGLGDHLAAGTTFEVYDKAEGVPGLGKDPLSDSGLPAGKASIEVSRVGQNSSECRIVHLAAGQTLTEGDIIANLVYDKNTTYNFVVWGNFDTDGNGVWTAQEADVIKSLVTRWGGKLQDKIGVSTDFLVLGKEPEVPALTKEEKEDPIRLAQFEKASADLKAYQDRIAEAATLGIPIMNQNRFLYYVGYFDQIRR